MEAARARRGQGEELIWAARICYLEATFRESDCAAILHVGRKRAAQPGSAWLDAVRAYSVLERVDNPRTREVRALPWDDVAGQGERFNARWLALRELVERFAFDPSSVADPCPSARDWGGGMDEPRGRMVPARCSVKTANTFYRIGSSRTVAAALASAAKGRSETKQ